MTRARVIGSRIEDWCKARRDRDTDLDHGLPYVAHGASALLPLKVIFVWPVTRTGS
jgi:hypothetical protein